MEQLTDNQLIKRITREQDNYLMDMENEALANWDNTNKVTGIGKERLKNEKWILHIREYIDDCCGLEEAMKQYVKWVENGGGDEWFNKED